MKRLFGYQQRRPENLLGMPTTVSPDYEYDMPPESDSPNRGEFIPPDELTLPTGSYLGAGGQTQMPKEQGKTGKVLDIISKIGSALGGISQNYWSRQGGPKGEAARANEMMNYYNKKILLESMGKGEASTNDMKNYQFYSEQERKNGKEPASFMQWKMMLNKSGASGGTDVSIPGLGELTSLIVGNLKDTFKPPPHTQTSSGDNTSTEPDETYVFDLTTGRLKKKSL